MKKPTYRKRCWTCKYAPGGHPWFDGRYGAAVQKLWCGVGHRMVLRGSVCNEWVLVGFPTRAMEVS